MTENTNRRGTSRYVKRILLCGLEKSGRSSIRRIVVKNGAIRNIEENGVALNYFNWHLTKEEDSPSITILDLGGKWPVLEKFISELSPSVFYGIQALLFVVDASEEDKFDSAKGYFKLVLQRVQDYSPSVRIFVFLNKVDLIATSSEKQKRREQLRKSFQELLEKEIGFHETTIHDNSAKTALCTILKEMMPEAARQIEARFEDRSIDLTQEEVEAVTTRVESTHPANKGLELVIESEEEQPEILQPVDSPLPSIPIPPTPSLPMNAGTEPSVEDRARSITLSEEGIQEEITGAKELREFLDQTQEDLDLTAVSLLTHDGRPLIKLGENLEQFDETIAIAHRIFESASEHISEGLEQLIVELADSYITINQVGEMLILVTKGAPPLIPKASQKLIEFARETASHTQRIGVVEELLKPPDFEF